MNIPDYVPTVRLSLPEPWHQELKDEIQRRFQVNQGQLHLHMYAVERNMPKSDVSWDWHEWSRLVSQEDITPRTMGFHLRTEPLESSTLEAFPELAFWRERIEKLRKAQSQMEEEQPFSKFFRWGMKLHHLEHRQQNLQRILQSITPKFEPLLPYYLPGVVKLFERTVVEISGMQQLEGVMKSLLRILIVDGLGNRMAQAIGKHGYSPNRVRTMRLQDLLHIRNRFLSNRPESDHKQAARSSDFLFQVPEFENFDLIYINPWKASAEQLSVVVAINKTKTLSRKEEERVAQQAQIRQQAEVLLGKRQKWKELLLQTQREVRAMEQTDPHDADEEHERHYQQLLQQRRRLIEHLKASTVEIRELLRPVKQEKNSAARTVNLYEVYPRESGFYRWATELVSTPKDPEVQRRDATRELQELSIWVREQLRLENTLQQREYQLKSLDERLQMLEFSDTFRKKTWRHIMLDYLVNHLEILLLEQTLVKYVERS
jgi:hypothetical protein